MPDEMIKEATLIAAQAVVLVIAMYGCVQVMLAL
jgi:hypothetical protein